MQTVIKMEFSKKIYLLNITFVISVIAISFVVMLLSGKLEITDLSPISVICTSAFTELGLHTAFYLNKAKAENVIKISKDIQGAKIKSGNIAIANAVMNGYNVESYSDENEN